MNYSKSKDHLLRILAFAYEDSLWTKSKSKPLEIYAQTHARFTRGIPLLAQHNALFSIAVNYCFMIEKIDIFVNLLN